MIGCNSRAGYIGGAVAALFFAVLIRKQLRKQWKAALILFGSFILIFAGMNVSSGGRALEKIDKLKIDLESAAEPTKQPVAGKIEDIVLDHDVISIISGKDSIKLVKEGSRLLFKTPQGEEIIYKVVKDTKTSEDSFILENQIYSNYKFSFDTKSYVMKMVWKGATAYFALTAQGWRVIGNHGRPDTLHQIEKVKLPLPESAGSTRIYIWSRSLPLLKETLLFGHGPDTFAVYFPQNDYVGKLQAYGRTNMLVDKPHNMYLQTAVNTGAVSLVALLVLLVILAFKGTVYLSRCAYAAFNEYLGAGCLAAAAGYCIAGFFNDSIVSVAPVFWVVLGIGAGIVLKKSSNPLWK
jgi:formylmethanofuran dehydrogenase subunit D